jgi:hypothetical protein
MLVSVATRKRRSARRKRARLAPGEYRGRYVRVRQSAVTRSGLIVPAGATLLAMEDEIAGWVPVLYLGRIELVARTALTRIPRRS